MSNAYRHFYGMSAAIAQDQPAAPTSNAAADSYTYCQYAVTGTHLTGLSLWVYTYVGAKLTA